MAKKMNKRGILTIEIQELAKDFLKREIDTTELQLYPYFDYVMKNEQWIDSRKINSDDRHIMMKLKNENHIDIHLSLCI
jgi:hypothetical protein